MASLIHAGEKSGGKSMKNAQDIADCLDGVASLTAFTDNSGGTAADTIAAIGATYDQDEVRNAVASLAAKINSIISQIGGN